MDVATFHAEVTADGQIVYVLPIEAVMAVCKRRYAYQRIEVEIRRRDVKRSDRQNRYLHAALTQWGHELGYHVDELKSELLALVFGTREVVSPITGQVRQVLNKPHTSKLSVRDCNTLIEFLVIEAAKTGCVIDLPDEWRAKTRAIR